MPKVRYSNKAVEDLSSIWDYTFIQWSENQADEYYAMLISACNRLLYPSIDSGTPQDSSRTSRQETRPQRRSSGAWAATSPSSSCPSPHTNVMAGLTGHLAASGAVDNINDSYNVPVPIFLQS